jgi:hypothetical protein
VLVDEVEGPPEVSGIVGGIKCSTSNINIIQMDLLAVEQAAFLPA